MWSAIWPYLAAIIPTIVVAYLFYLIMKAILESDRRERAAVAKWEAEQERLRIQQGEPADGEGPRSGSGVS